ncbi:MAG: CapA family protein [Myxococcaceae bacterium]
MILSFALLLSIAAAPEAGDAEYERGIAALKNKDATAAVTELRACLEASPTRADCHWELGWAYSVEGNWTEALTQWEAVKKLAPRHPELDANLKIARARVAQQKKVAAASNAAPKAPPSDAGPLRLRAAGDVMLGTEIPEGNLPPDDGATSLEAVASLLQDADLTFLNLEGPLCDNGESKKCPRPTNTCYAFRSPTRYGKYIEAAGVDFVSTANNHSGDYGESCRRETEATLDSLGIKWSGPPGSVAKLQKNGLKIALIAFHTSAACNYLNDHGAAVAMVKAAAAESDVVIVSFHGGAEGAKALAVPEGKEMFHGENRGDLRVFTKKMVDAGADLILGHGPHVLRGLEVYKERLIVYSMGNFATYGRFDLSGNLGVGMIVETSLAPDGKFLSGRIIPTVQEGRGIPKPDPSARAVKLVRRLTTEGFPELGPVIEDDGTIRSRDTARN